jgi:hypothetical protein
MIEIPPELPERLRADVRVPRHQGLWQIRHKPATTSISLDVSTVYTFDGEGRPWSCLLDGIHYRRGFDGRVRARGLSDGPPRRWLTATRARELWTRVHTSLGRLMTGLDEATINSDDPQIRHDLGHLLRRLLSWDAARQAQDVAAFGELYTSVPILPPDRYNALLVQITRGCAWNRCTFCDLYRDRSYEVRSTLDLDEHMASIRSFFGKGLQARRHLFLGDANLLAVPSARLLPLIARVQDAFPDSAFRELSAFADVLSPSRHTDDDLQAIARLGLRHVYFGLESGSDAVRGLLGKAGGAADAIAAARRLRACGLSVGIIVLLGAGGDGLAQDHVEQTARTLRSMRLQGRDIVFFSPLRAGGDYERQMHASGLRAVDDDGMQQQRCEIESVLTPRDSGGPRRALYDIEDFVY